MEGEVVNMLSIAVCDDEVVDCCRLARKIKEILEKMKIACTIRQFCNGRDLLQAPESFDMIFLDIIMDDLNGMKTFLHDIYYFEMKGRIIDVHGSDGIFAYYEQIGEMEDNLREKGFFRCHKSYLVNLKYVDGYNRREVILDNGERIAIAKRRYETEEREENER